MIADFCQSAGFAENHRPGPAASLACSEVVRLSVFGQWAQFPSERAFYRYALDHLRAAFPTLPEREQFNRLQRGYREVIVAFALFLVKQMQVQGCLYEALDSSGIPTRDAKRRGTGWLAGQADIGWSNRIGWYEGVHLLTSMTPTGMITGFGFAPASCNDKVRWSKDWQRWLARLRQIIETIYDKLLNTFRLARERPHALDGLQARLAAKVALHNFCMWLNLRLGREPLAFAGLLKW
jgi:hypothetical protein